MRRRSTVSCIPSQPISGSSEEEGSEQEKNIPWFCDIGPNDAYVQEMFRLYQQDPALVGEVWTHYFEDLARTHAVQGDEQQNQNSHSHTSSNEGSSASASEPAPFNQVNGYYTAPSGSPAAQERVYRMISAFRGRGHFKAKINPLTQGVLHLPEVEDVNVDFYQFSPEQLSERFFCSGLALREQMTLQEIIDKLDESYCGSIGFEFTHLLDQDERLWLQERIENRFERGYRLTRAQRVQRLKKVIEAEAFESELHKKYVGHKRFSLQGTETLIPMLDNLLEEAASGGVQKIVIGMPHRGRLNVLVNIVGKPLEEVFSEFEDQSVQTALGSGDVKYHMGFESTHTDINGREIQLQLAPNPSHLEFVNPVVEGIVRAAQDNEHNRNRKAVLPVLMHGDAAFAGQGVVFETLNMSLVRGYRVGGTVHIVVNNQIGFTTDPEDSRSSVYCTDMGKAVQAPVFHVNCEDVEASCWAIKTALDFRNEYGRDVIIDLYGYRKYGHNEGDDPSFTQPVSYKEITKKTNIAEIYTNELINEGTVTREEADALLKEFKDKFSSANIEPRMEAIGDAPAESPADFQTEPQTRVSMDTLEMVATSLIDYPESFVPHPKLTRILEKRVASLQEAGGIDWGFAEALAFGALQLDGVSVRLSGQDSGRGTFSQRHLALNHHERQERFFPLQRLQETQGGAPNVGGFEVVNSTLSEAGVLGFEFGYSTIARKHLVLWEAQFGDFANGAQVHIDQFLVSSESKWGQRSGLVLLLPHGYEGQGPEHSSARLERFLQLCAEENITVAYPSSGAQHFHLLRRQGLTESKRPLVIMTPKSLLRLPEAGSSVEQLTDGAFQPIISEKIGDPQSSSRCAVLLSGKIYYDVRKKLEQMSSEMKDKTFTLCRIEQLYPFPRQELQSIIEKDDIHNCFWVQEEPENMGAWRFVNNNFQQSLGVDLHFIGRSASASTATGSAKRHALEQANIVQHVVDSVVNADGD
ncbi:2-oxoglutarate dehydrogenase E1 component [bacterium]|nr:2-oxoglutarate dehydrogenase E1 component [bacterium]